LDEEVTDGSHSVIYIGGGVNGGNEERFVLRWREVDAALQQMMKEFAKLGSV
jgi:hypothetical protein